MRSEPRRELALPAFLPPACHYVVPRVLFLKCKMGDVIHLCHTLNYFPLLRRKIIQRPQEDTFSPTLPSKSLPRLLPVLGHQSLPGPVPAVILLETLLPFAACQLLILYVSTPVSPPREALPKRLVTPFTRYHSTAKALITI